MDDPSLNLLLAQYRKTPVVALPGNFRQYVWREIRRRKVEVEGNHGSWFGWLLEPLFKRERAFSALAFALVLGIGLGAVPLDSQNAQTRSALGLQVFGSSSPALPSTLMGFTK